MLESSRILFVDAYDSFSRNIIALIHQCVSTAQVTTIRIDTDIQRHYGARVEEFVLDFDAIVLGPGPGDPRNAHDIGLFPKILDAAIAGQVPVLGICLGFQVLCLHHGHAISRLPVPCHGQSKHIISRSTDIFHDLRCGPYLSVISYNSWGVHKSSFSSLADQGLLTGEGAPSCSSSGASTPRSTDTNDSDHLHELEVLAWDEDGFIMAVRHSQLPLWGLQFHPESCGSSDGTDIMRSWWSLVEQFYCNTSDRRSRSASRHNLKFQLHPEVPPPIQAAASSTVDRTLDQRGHVSWIMTKLKSLTAHQLSRFCHNVSKGYTMGMLESIAKGRHCIYAITDQDTQIATYTAGRLVISKDKDVVDEREMTLTQALAEMEKRTKGIACTDGCPNVPFWGGWVGFMSYESGLDLLNVSSSERRMVPDFQFMLVERSIVLDQRTADVCVQSTRSNDTLWLQETRTALQKLSSTASETEPPAYLHETLTRSKYELPDHETYTNKIVTCQEQLCAGNSYELCLTTEARLDVPSSTSTTSYNLYRNLIKHNPVPFAAYLHFPSIPSVRHNGSGAICGTTVLSSSPEQFLSCSRTGTLDMIPMKGTVQRTPTTRVEDAIKILNSPKESAENLMIADLIRHDLHGVVGCENPVWVPALNSIKQFETVYQLVSHIRAPPPPTMDVNDPEAVIAHSCSALQHTLPPGSMTGAPKKRSCEILQQLEQRNRGVYSGIIGYIDVGGACSWSVAIRTAFSSEAEDYIGERDIEEGDQHGELIEIQKRKVWHVGAGGAVTVLSDVEGEWQEMMGKLGNVLKAFKEVKREQPKWRPE